MKKKDSRSKSERPPRTDLVVSWGRISEDDRLSDIEFWQRTSFSERARLSLEMAEDVFRLKNGKDPRTMSFRRDYVESGALCDRKKEET